MYINPVLVGIAMTLAVEFVILMIAYTLDERKDEYENDKDSSNK